MQSYGMPWTSASGPASQQVSFPGPSWMQPVSMGTTLVAVEYDGGVVVGTDSRTSSGAFIANRVADKITKITDKIYCCRSGVAAHTQAVADIVSYHMSFLSVQLNDEPRVRVAANVFRDLCYNYRDQFTAGIICAGWDRVEGGQVYSIPIGGMLVRQKVSAGGSGSTYIYGYLDSQYKAGMKRDECVEFVKKGVALAMSRDGASGGIIRLAVIDEKGVERMVLANEEIPRFHED